MRAKIVDRFVAEMQKMRAEGNMEDIAGVVLALESIGLSLSPLAENETQFIMRRMGDA